MSNLYTPEQGATYGYLDSLAFAEGIRVGSHELRELARGSNHLLSEGDVILSMPFDSQTVDPDEEKLGGFILGGSGTGWQRAYWGPLVVPKKPTHVTGVLRVIAKITASHNVWLQVATTGSGPLVAGRIDGPNTLEMTGTGDWESYELTGIQLGPGDTESIALYQFGSMAECVTPNPTTTVSGAVAACWRTHFECAGAAFEAASRSDFRSGRYSVQFQNGNGTAILPPIRLHGPTGYAGAANSDLMAFEDEIPENWVAMIEDADFVFLETGAVRFSSIVIAEEDLL